MNWWDQLKQKGTTNETHHDRLFAAVIIIAAIVIGILIWKG